MTVKPQEIENCITGKKFSEGKILVSLKSVQ